MDLDGEQLDASERSRAERPLRVLHFRRIFSQATETFVYDQVIEMDRRDDVEARVLCLLRLGEVERPFPALRLIRVPPAAASGARQLRSPLVRRLWQSDSVLWPLVRWRIRPLVERERPDVVLAHFGPDGYLMAPVAERLGIPLAVGFYGYDVSRLVCGGSERRWRRRYRRLFDQAALLVAISNHVAGRLVELGAPPEKVKVLPLGCRLERFTTARRRTNDPAVCRFVHVGRLTAKKAPLVLLQAFEHACRLVGDAVLLQLSIAGDGELAAATEAERTRLGLTERVELLGHVPHDDVAALLARSDVYVQHCVTAPDGDQEGLGLAFLEASASGLPIATTDHAGIADVVVDGVTGLLSPEGDAAAMGANLAALATDPQRRATLARFGRARVLARFGLEHTLDELLGALRGIACGAPGPEHAAVVWPESRGPRIGPPGSSEAHDAPPDRSPERGRGGAGRVEVG